MADGPNLSQRVITRLEPELKKALEVVGGIAKSQEEYETLSAAIIEYGTVTIQIAVEETYAEASAAME